LHIVYTIGVVGVFDDVVYGPVGIGLTGWQDWVGDAVKLGSSSVLVIIKIEDRK